MTERDRTILSLSDDEIVMWWATFHECPPGATLRSRLEHLMRERPEFQPGAELGPIRYRFTGREAELAWHIRASVAQQQRADDEADLQQRARYAVENLIGQRLPAFTDSDPSIDVHESKLVTSEAAA